jgi:hypothetical protein
MQHLLLLLLGWQQGARDALVQCWGSGGVRVQALCNEADGWQPCCNSGILHACKAGTGRGCCVASCTRTSAQALAGFGQWLQLPG